MALSLYVKVDGVVRQASVESLDEAECVVLHRVWKRDCELNPERYTRRARLAALNWDYSHVLQDATTGEVYGLRVEGVAGFSGVLALDYDGKTSEGEPCPKIQYIAKSPNAFDGGIAGVAKALVMNALDLSVVGNMKGAVFIPEALGPDPENALDCPADLYRRLGFVTLATESYPHGVTYDRMEISAEQADAQLRRYRDGA